MQTGNFLIEVLGENVDLASLVFIGVSLGVKLDLGKSLVGERRGHDK